MDSSRRIWSYVPRPLLVVVCLGLVVACVGLGGFFVSSVIAQQRMLSAWEDFESNPWERLDSQEPIFGDYSPAFGSVFWRAGAAGMLVVLAGVPLAVIVTIARYSKRPPDESA